MKKYIKSLLASVLVGALLSGCGSKGDTVKDDGIKDYVATVNNQKITENEYRYFLMSIKNSIEQSNNVQDEAASKALWEGKLQDKPAEEYAKELALEDAKEYKILLTKAKEAGYKPNEEEVKSVNDQIDQYVASLGTGEEGNKKFKDQFSLTVEAYKAINSDMSTVQQYFTEEIEKTKLDEAELKKYYEDNKTKLEVVTVKHVLFMTVDQATMEPLPKEKQEEAKKKADDILAKVKAGEDIAALAKQYSEDGGSKDKGGEYTFPRGQMVKEFEDWSFKAKVGDVGIVKTTYGYHVIRLEKTGFEAAKENVENTLKQKKYSDQLDQWKKDPKNELVKNEAVYNNIKILNTTTDEKKEQTNTNTNTNTNTDTK